jgi:CBS domain-containing protein
VLKPVEEDEMTSIREVMSPDPIAMPETATIVEVAREMQRREIGDVIVMGRGGITGVVTDRDIVVRGVAEARDPSSTPIGEIASRGIVSVTPDASVSDAANLMRTHSIRRVPVIDSSGEPVGIVSIGDLAVDRDPDSALADISAAPANN